MNARKLQRTQSVIKLKLLTGKVTPFILVQCNVLLGKHASWHSHFFHTYHLTKHFCRTTYPQKTE